jgi:hypothetical protein
MFDGRTGGAFSSPQLVLGRIKICVHLFLVVSAFANGLVLERNIVDAVRAQVTAAIKSGRDHLKNRISG